MAIRSPSVRRVLAVVGAVAPVASIRRDPVTGWVVTYADTATPGEIAAGDAALASLDWSAQAWAAWLKAERRADSQAQWDVWENVLLRAFALVVLDEINTLRGQHGLPARTMQQLKTATLNKIQAGTAD